MTKLPFLTVHRRADNQGRFAPRPAASPPPAAAGPVEIGAVEIGAVEIGEDPARVKGDAAFSATRPFPVEVVPARPVAGLPLE